MKPFLHTVSITGADFYVNNLHMGLLTERHYPFVEWGILLAKTRQGKENRYPPVDWIEDLFHFRKGGNPLSKIRLAGHLCGTWARDFASDGTMFMDDHPDWLGEFERIQLNLSHVVSEINVNLLSLAVSRHPTIEFIIQINETIPLWFDMLPSNCSFLFDHSGGRGLLPSGGWQSQPAPRMNLISYPRGMERMARHATPPRSNCGYAGGLTPDNLAEQLPLISFACGGAPIWIDAESGLRTDDVFDLDKATKFLDAAKPYVINGAADADDKDRNDATDASGGHPAPVQS